MNAEIVLPLEKMTFSEKMEVIETVWDDILSHPEEAEWPGWHETYLKSVEDDIQSGTAKFIDFDTAKERLLTEKL